MGVDYWFTREVEWNLSCIRVWIAYNGSTSWLVSVPSCCSIDLSFNAPSNRHISSFEERPLVHTKHIVGNCFEFARVRHFPCWRIIPSVVLLCSSSVSGRGSDLLPMWGALRAMAGWTGARWLDDVWRVWSSHRESQLVEVATGNTATYGFYDSVMGRHCDNVQIALPTYPSSTPFSRFNHS